MSDAECIRLLKTGPVILMERFRDVACSNPDLEESMPTVTFQFLSRHMIKFSPSLAVRSDKKSLNQEIGLGNRREGTSEGYE